jgi:DNA-directed RNA polymerase specialized sigma24 family protein
MDTTCPAGANRPAKGLRMIDDGELERLVAASATGDQRAWGELWSAIQPALLRYIAQPRFLGRLGQGEDDRRNIVVQVMERLRKHDFHRLRLYLDARRGNPRLRFMGWLRVVAKRVGVDYLRAHPDYVRRHDAGASEPGHWVEQKTLPPASRVGGERPPVTNRGTARELLRFAAGAIPAEQVRALELWIASETFSDIATALGLRDAREAERLVRAAIERLRRHYRDHQGEPS